MKCDVSILLKVNILPWVSFFVLSAQNGAVHLLLSYFKNFEGRIEYSDFKKKYCFDTSQIKCGDYFFIYTLEDKSIGQSVYGKYDDYDVYYVDMEKCIMYYIHSNI